MAELPIQIFNTLDSTNAEAKRQLQAGSITQPTLLWAKQQTAGRGTRGRSWVSEPQQGLYVSLAVPESHISHAIQNALPGAFTQRVGEQLAIWLRADYGLPVFVKPINDLYAPMPDRPEQAGKLGGILVESLVQGDRWQGLIIGVGINWWQAPEGLTDPPAVCAVALNPALAQLPVEPVVNALGTQLSCL